jgi:hypothetical protein
LGKSRTAPAFGDQPSASTQLRGFGQALQLRIVLGGHEPDPQGLASPLERSSPKSWRDFGKVLVDMDQQFGSGLDGRPH